MLESERLVELELGEAEEGFVATLVRKRIGPPARQKAATVRVAGAALGGVGSESGVALPRLIHPLKHNASHGGAACGGGRDQRCPLRAEVRPLRQLVCASRGVVVRVQAKFRKQQRLGRGLLVLGVEVLRPGLALGPVALEAVHVKRSTRRLQAGDVPEIARHRHRYGVPRAQRVLRAAHRGCQLSDLSVTYCRLLLVHAVHLLIGNRPHEQRWVARRLLDDIGQGSWVVVEVVGDAQDHAKSVFGARVQKAEVVFVEAWIPVVHTDHVGAERCDEGQIARPDGPVRLIEDVGRRHVALCIAF